MHFKVFLVLESKATTFCLRLLYISSELNSLYWQVVLNTTNGGRSIWTQGQGYWTTTKPQAIDRYIFLCFNPLQIFFGNFGVAKITITGLKFQGLYLRYKHLLPKEILRLIV